MIFSPRKSLILIALLTVVAGCSGKSARPDMTAQERFDHAKKLFDKGDYLDAKTQFKIMTLRHSGSGLVDQAQYYLAECHFKLKEHILAAEEYARLIRVYPKSDLCDDAQFKVGQAYYKLSPGYALDQKYTYKAIQEFQAFLDEYPESDLRGEAEESLRSSREKLAKKDYKNGVLYRKMGDYAAAVVYFEDVLSQFYDTGYAENALYWKSECHRQLGELETALESFEAFAVKYPDSQHGSKVKNRILSLRKSLGSGRGANSQE